MTKFNITLKPSQLTIITYALISNYFKSESPVTKKIIIELLDKIEPSRKDFYNDIFPDGHDILIDCTV